MTVAAAHYPPNRGGTTRWTASLLIVIALHAGLVLILALRRVPIEPIGTPPAAVMIDLAPLPTEAPAEPLPPVVEPQVQTPPPEPPPEAIPAPQPETPKLAPSPAPHPAVTLPAQQPPKPKNKVKRIEQPPTPHRVVEPAPALPAPAHPAIAPPAAASQPSAAQNTASSAASTRASWQAQLIAWLEKYKRYPRVAQEQRQQGVVYLRFAIDRQGKVLSSQVSKSSGFELLDAEVLALMERAQPVPAPPPEVGGNRIELQVPVAFSLRR